MKPISANLPVVSSTLQPLLLVSPLPALPPALSHPVTHSEVSNQLPTPLRNEVSNPPDQPRILSEVAEAELNEGVAVDEAEAAVEDFAYRKEEESAFLFAD